MSTAALKRFVTRDFSIQDPDQDDLKKIARSLFQLSTGESRDYTWLHETKNGVDNLKQLQPKFDKFMPKVKVEKNTNTTHKISNGHF